MQEAVRVLLNEPTASGVQHDTFGLGYGADGQVALASKKVRDGILFSSVMSTNLTRVADNKLNALLLSDEATELLARVCEGDLTGVSEMTDRLCKAESDSATEDTIYTAYSGFIARSSNSNGGGGGGGGSSNNRSSSSRSKASGAAAGGDTKRWVIPSDNPGSEEDGVNVIIESGKSWFKSRETVLADNVESLVSYIAQPFNAKVGLYETKLSNQGKPMVKVPLKCVGRQTASHVIAKLPSYYKGMALVIRYVANQGEENDISGVPEPTKQALVRMFLPARKMWIAAEKKRVETKRVNPNNT
jgi:hypothetical protein